MATKVGFVKALQKQATMLALLGTDLGSLAEVYIDRGYDDNNAIEAADAEQLGLTVAQVEATIGIVPTLLGFLDNETNRAILNNMRTDI